MIRNKKEHESLVRSGMFWEFHPLLSGDWEKDKSYFEMEKAKTINTDNFEGNIKIDLNKEKEVIEITIKNPIKENWIKAEYLQSEINDSITLEDELEMWKQLEKNLVEPKESSIIKSAVLEKYINKLKEKELVYKECVNCDSGMVLISEAVQILRELEAELSCQFLKTKI